MSDSFNAVMKESELIEIMNSDLPLDNEQFTDNDDDDDDYDTGSL